MFSLKFNLFYVYRQFLRFAHCLSFVQFNHGVAHFLEWFPSSLWIKLVDNSDLALLFHFELTEFILPYHFIQAHIQLIHFVGLINIVVDSVINIFKL